MTAHEIKVLQDSIAEARRNPLSADCMEKFIGARTEREKEAAAAEASALVRSLGEKMPETHRIHALRMADLMDRSRIDPSRAVMEKLLEYTLFFAGRGAAPAPIAPMAQA